MINRKKIDWETFNTPKIKIVFHSDYWIDSDYGTKLRIKCHQRIQRKDKSINGELCTNWNRIDSFGIKLDFHDSIYHIDGYEKFYDDPTGLDWKDPGNGL